MVRPGIQAKSLVFPVPKVKACSRALAELVRRRPDDAGAQHNLGVMLARLGRFEEAVHAFRASLRFRPRSAITNLCLGYALVDAGRPWEARRAFEACRRLAVGEPLAAEAQRRLDALAA